MVGSDSGNTVPSGAEGAAPDQSAGKGLHTAMRRPLLETANGRSLEEINSTVRVPVGGGFLKNLLAYSGPGALVAVGYMDPGNWITSIGGGAQFGYLLMSVILL